MKYFTGIIVAGYAGARARVRGRRRGVADPRGA